MKKLISVLLSLCMLLALMPITAQADTWYAHADVYINGVKYDNINEPIRLPKNHKLFITFTTDDENTAHGYAPLVGFADGYEGGMLSSAGFGVVTGNASQFGMNYTAWGFGSDPFGFLLTAENLATGTTGTLDYFLYLTDNFSWDTFDFVTTPRAETKTLSFVVEDAAPLNGPNAASEFTRLKLYAPDANGNYFNEYGWYSGEEYILYQNGQAYSDVYPGFSYNPEENILTIDSVNNPANGALWLEANMMGDDFSVRVDGRASLAHIRICAYGYGGNLHIIGNGELTVNADKKFDTAIEMQADDADGLLTIGNDVRVTLFSDKGKVIETLNSVSPDVARVYSFPGMEQVRISRSNFSYEVPEKVNSLYLDEPETERWGGWLADCASDPDSFYVVNTETEENTGNTLYTLGRYVYVPRYNAYVRDYEFGDRYSNGYEYVYTEEQWNAQTEYVVREKPSEDPEQFRYYLEDDLDSEDYYAADRVRRTSDPDGMYGFCNYTKSVDDVIVFTGYLIQHYVLAPGTEKYIGDTAFEDVEITAEELAASDEWNIVYGTQKESLEWKGNVIYGENNLYEDSAGNQYVTDLENNVYTLSNEGVTVGSGFYYYQDPVTGVNFDDLEMSMKTVTEDDAYNYAVNAEKLVIAPADAPSHSFEVQPAGGVIPVGQNGITVTWRTDFTPVRQVLYNVDDEVVRELNATDTSLRLTEADVDSYIRAYFGTGDNDYVDSQRIPVFKDYKLNVPGKVYLEYGNTDCQLLGSVSLEDNSNDNPLTIMIDNVCGKLVNVNDPSDELPLRLYSEIEDLPYIIYEGENYIYREHGDPDRPNFPDSLTTLAGERDVIYIDGIGTDAELEPLKDIINGKVLMVNRGGLSFSLKCNNAVKYGAAGVIVANNADGEFGMMLDEYTYTKPAVAVEKALADKFKSKATYVSGEHPYYLGRMTFTDENTTIRNLIQGDWFRFYQGYFGEQGTLYAMVEDWSSATPGAVYKAVITYKTYKDDYNGARYNKTFTSKTELIAHKHQFDSGKVTKAATATAEGEKTYTCACGFTKTEKIPKLPPHTVHIPDKGTVTKKPTYTATGLKEYKCTECGAVIKTEVLPKLAKKKNTMTVVGKKVKVRLAKLKKKDQTVDRKKAITVSKAKGTVSYTRLMGNKKITINKKSGKITVKKGLKKGAYKIKIKVKAAGTTAYTSKTQTVTVTIIVQ